jgi:hypothetical protein
MADWIVIVLLLWFVGALVAIVLVRMAGDQDRAARHLEKAISPFSDVTITHHGEH